MPDVHPPAGVHGVLSALADIAEEATPDRPSSPLPDAFTWVDLRHTSMVTPSIIPPPPLALADAATLQRFAAIDAIRPGEPSLRVGWLWVAGTTTDAEGQRRQVFEPLVTLEAEVDGAAVRLGDEHRLTPLITDHAERLRLEARIRESFGGGAFDGMGPAAPAALLLRMPKMSSFARQAAAAAGLPAQDLRPAKAGPAALAGSPELRLVVGLALYASDAAPDFSAAGSLRLWHGRVGTTWTALHALYLDRPAPPDPPAEDLPSAYRLTVAQHACVAESRTAPITVISGAPGTGKTHTIAAIVGDAVARGRSVLVAAKSEATVAAITELLAAEPGPDPVVFGSGGRRTDLAARLAAGQPGSVPAEEVARRQHEVQRALADRDQLWQSVARGLAGLSLLGRAPQAAALRHRLPGLSRPGVDLFEVQALIQQVGRTPPRWWQPAARRRWQRVGELLGVSGTLDPTDLDRALDVAVAARGLHQATDPLTGGLDVDALVGAQQLLEQAAGRWMDATAHDERRLTRSVRASRAALATALRAGRAKRRAMLAQLGAEVCRALPVWVGTLGDIDDLLPMTPAMFDLVVLDEASSIDQPRAATALLRGRRAVVVGDPRQLRHVSFVPDAAIGAAIHRHLPGASPGLAARLDVRANSIFDVAASAAPVRQLDEHFRSGAHLFEFVGRELYDDAVRVATLTPATDGHDQIAVVRLAGVRDRRKVVQAEVDWVLQRLSQLRAAGACSVGVVSPFRAQADAIEDAVLPHLTFEGIRALGLRVGTVHAFQGMERDVVLVSLGIGEGDGPGTWRFADDANLFAVMATRARRRLEWGVSADPPEGSRIAAYLQQADAPPAPQRGVTAHAHPWARQLVEHLQELELSAPYLAGRHALDLALANDGAFLGVQAILHPAGPHAHVRRHVELARNGWPLVTALEAQWGDRPAELALLLRRALAEQVRRR